MAEITLNDSQALALTGTTDPQTGIVYPGDSPEGWEAEANRLIDRLNKIAMLSNQLRVYQDDSGPRKVGIKEGMIEADGAVLIYSGGVLSTLTDEAITYVWAYNASGAVAIGTSTTAWPGTAHIKLAKVVCDDGVIAMITDFRGSAIAKALGSAALKDAGSASGQVLLLTGAAGDAVYKNAGTSAGQVFLLAQNASDAAYRTVGTSANNLVALDGTGKLPAVNGSNLTNLPSVEAAALALSECLRVYADTSGPRIVGVKPGGFAIDGVLLDYAGGLLSALTDAATTYIWAFNNSGVAGIVSSTSAFPGTAHIKLATVVCAGGVITSITDFRPKGVFRFDTLGSAAAKTAGSASGNVLLLTAAAGDSVYKNAGTSAGQVLLLAQNAGDAAYRTVGTSANNVVALDGTGKLPAVNASQLTNLPGVDATSINGWTVEPFAVTNFLALAFNKNAASANKWKATDIGYREMQVTTSNATATDMITVGEEYTSIVISNNSARVVAGMVIARDQANNDVAAWKFEILVRKATTDASAAVVGSASVTQIAASSGASTWSIAVAANTTLGGVKVTVTGQSSKTIKWRCRTHQALEESGG